MTIDLNCDMGELASVPEEELMPLISSTSVACGAHAGDPDTMKRTIRLAIRCQVAIGAHPGYPDKENFGRLELPMTPAEIEDSVYDQVSALARLAESLGSRLRHVKPHGALYNTAARNPGVASAIASGVSRWREGVPLIGPAGSGMLEVWREAGFPVLAEAFADRAYEPDGSLRSRRLPGALITIPDQAADQALRIARIGSAQTICIHGDTPGAVAIAAAVRARLHGHGFVVAPPAGL
jgi:5-oxoprolinase (ATP-hydrolysing) subunit A